MAVIDFHSHILPGIDDGSKNVETSLSMLKMAADQGVGIMIATPHFYASMHRVEYFLENRQNAFDLLKVALGDHKDMTVPKILCGAEVAFFSGISQADKLDELTIAGTNLLLLEMPFRPWTDRDIREIKAIIEERHFQILFAHIERYTDIGSNKRRFTELIMPSAYVQINAESVSDGGLFGTLRRRQLIRMFKNGTAHFLGSDCHGIHHRPPNLADGREMLKSRLGSDFLRDMDRKGSRLLGLEGENYV